jgi:hypothetical protein
VRQELLEGWSPSRSPANLPEQFADDERMRISHEAIYQTLFVQAGGGCAGH